MKIFLLMTLVVALASGCRNKNATASEPDRGIRIPDSSYIIAAVMNDADDPVNSLGIDINIGEDNPPLGDLEITASSSNPGVVPDKNIVFSGTGNTRNVKISPVAAGYSSITVTVSDGGKRRYYLLNYAASQSTPGKRWHTGISDASAAIIIDDEHMLVANDETNYLYLYNRTHSGLPVKTFDFNQGNVLGLTDSTRGGWREVDVEGAVRSTNDSSVIYWIGSMSNNGLFINKPNRNRLLAVNISGKGPALHITNAGSYSNLRQKLIAWGDKHGYGFTASAGEGRNPKTMDGFNIEGMVFGPDNKTMYIGFRAPLVPTARRTKAVIAPIRNFESWFNKGQPAGNPSIGTPIELDLGGRGIRDIIRLPDNSYVIIAGSCGADIVPAVYTWTGKASDAAVLADSFALAGLNVEGVIPVFEGGQFSLNKLQVLTDNGRDLLYGDTVSTKDLEIDNFKKFSSVITESAKPKVPSGKQ